MAKREKLGLEPLRGSNASGADSNVFTSVPVSLGDYVLV